MLTDFGRLLRKIRIDCDEIIKDMAKKLDVTASFLSAVETGKRNIPEHWVDSIADIYHLDQAAKQRLQAAAVNSARSIKLNLEHHESDRRETAILFARELEHIDEETMRQIRRLLTKNHEVNMNE